MNQESPGFSRGEQVKSEQSTEAFASIVDDFANRFEGSFTREEIQRIVDKSRDDLAPTSRIPQFLPVLVRRFTQDRLSHLAKEKGVDQHGVQDVLFVCNGNAGRSQMAAAFANNLGSGKVRAWSAGLNPHSDVLEDVVTVMNERGINVADSFSKPLTSDATHAADYLVAIGIPPQDLPQEGKHTIEWDVPPVIGQSLETTRRTRDELERRVTVLLAGIIEGGTLDRP